jgi:hypothetical protein
MNPILRDVPPTGWPDRRFRMIRISMREMLDQFRRPTFTPSNDQSVIILRSLSFPDLPEDAQVVMVNFSHQYMGWEIILHHDSWKSVMEGDRIPELSGIAHIHQTNERWIKKPDNKPLL